MSGVIAARLNVLDFKNIRVGHEVDGQRAVVGRSLHCLQSGTDRAAFLYRGVAEGSSQRGAGGDEVVIHAVIEVGSQCTE